MSIQKSKEYRMLKPMIFKNKLKLGARSVHVSDCTSLTLRVQRQCIKLI